MAKSGETDIDRTLRWMTENLTGAYLAKHPEGHENAGKHCTNSGTCIIACCYINALGKVLLKGGPAAGRRDFVRFQTFLHRCMNDFMIESATVPLLSQQTPKNLNRTGGDEWLYEVFRCGFVHGYPKTGFAWGRSQATNKYWLDHKGRLTLNIDELVRGFLRGIEEFRRLAAADPDIETRFTDYITAG